MKRLKLILWTLFILIVSACAAFFLFKNRIINYLSINNPVKAEYLLVEGWVSSKSLDRAAEEFKNNEYSDILVTGLPVESWYIMDIEGLFEFSFTNDPVSLNRGDSLKLKLKGSKAKNEFARFQLFINNIPAGESYTTDQWKEYLFVADSSFQLSSLTLFFDNDEIEGKLDRNLIVGSLELKDSIIPARSENNMFYDRNDPQRKKPVTADLHSVAEIAASKLISKGIPEESITIIPALDVEHNRTLNSAISVKKWFDSHPNTGKSVNIFSENIHSRRSWILYRSALRDHVDKIGIISGEGKGDEDQNIKINTKNILRELAGNIYYRIFYRSGAV